MSSDVSSHEICLVLTNPQNPQDDPGNGQLDVEYRQVLVNLGVNNVNLIDLRQTQPDNPTPWVTLVRQGQPTRRMFFYGTGQEPATAQADLINRAILGAPERRFLEPQTQLRLVAAFPNRSIKGQQIDSDGGGPAGPPDPIAAAPAVQNFGQFIFTDPALQGIVNAGAQQPVTVAILDTWPPDNQIVAAGPNNALLGAIVDRRNGVGAAIGVSRPPLPTIISTLPNMSDHGLFIAGIVHSIAPAVPIEVVRVLDDRTSGDVWTIFNGVRSLQIAGVLTSNNLTILNLSLCFHLAAPPATTLSEAQQLAHVALQIETHFGINTATADAAAAALLNSVPAGVDLYKFDIEIAYLSLMFPYNVLVVAAAGNDGPDSLGLPQHELAPARYGIDFGAMLPVLGGQLPFPVRCQFLGVAAVSGDQNFAPARASLYTNRGEIAILGGDVLPPYPTPNFNAIQFPNLPGGLPDTIVGIASDPAFASGWCNWAGTSFSAAIVSGIAAAVAANSAVPLDAATLRAQVTGFADPLAIASLGCMAIIAEQIRI